MLRHGVIYAVVLLWGGLLRAQGASGECSAEEPTVYLTSPAASHGVFKSFLYTGETLEFEVTARLRTAFTDPDSQVQGYSISVEHDPGVLTIIDASSKGLNIITQGLSRTDIVGNETGAGFVSFAVVCDCALPPVSDGPLVRATYRLETPSSQEEPTSPTFDIRTRIEYRDGLRGLGEPVSNRLTVRGDPVTPCAEGIEAHIRVAESLEFIRGDANYDGVLDISDPVTLLHSQFQGDARVHCDDAGDANDDGKLDLSDAIFTFNYLFLGGRPPPAPFPDRGIDPTPDKLRCRPEARPEVSG